MSWRDFIFVVKPGIVTGNTAVAIGAFFLGSGDGVKWTHLVGLTTGLVCVVAASCVVNNYTDRHIDAKMSRTRKRPSVTGALPLRIAVLYASALYIVGFGLLLLLTNAKVAAIGLFGAVGYTVVYAYAKRRSYWGTFVGAFPGATPPLAGYVAATGRFDLGALLLFTAMFCWQMPHFYAIGLYRMEEYRAAHIPVLPIVKGLRRTVWEMRAYGALFIVCCYLLANRGYAGFMFGLAMVSIGLYWLVPMCSPDWRRDTAAVARLVFKRSLSVLLIFAVFLGLSRVLL